MKRIVALALMMLVLPSCLRVFRPWEHKRRTQCAANLPVFYEEPDREYRVIRVLRAPSDDELIWRACKFKAEALLMLRKTAEIRGALGETTITTSSSRDAHSPRGAAIRFVDRDTSQP